MTDFLLLHDAEQIAAEAEPAVKPGLARVFAGMVRRPAETLAEAFAHPIQSYAVILAAAGGVYWTLNAAIAQAGGDAVSLPVTLAAILLVGIPAGAGYLFAFSILINWACDILGGQPTRKKVRVTLAYAGVPGIIALVLLGLPKILIFGQSLFLQGRPWMSANPALVWGLWFGDALCFAWSWLLVVKALKIMNGFSTGKAIAAAVLPLGPILLIGMLFVAIVWGGVFMAPPAF